LPESIWEHNKRAEEGLCDKYVNKLCPTTIKRRMRTMTILGIKWRDIAEYGEYWDRTAPIMGFNDARESGAQEIASWKGGE